MASEAHQHDDEGASLNLLGQLIARLASYGQNASNNLQDTFTNMSMKHWIRLTVIVGGYMLLRPYVLKAISHGAVKNMEKQDAKEKEEAAKMTPNDLRGVYEKLDEQEEDEEEEETGVASWGQQARVRQRRVLRQLLEAEEKRRQEEDEDKDIQEYLED